MNEWSNKMFSRKNTGRAALRKGRLLAVFLFILMSMILFTGCGGTSDLSAGSADNSAGSADNSADSKAGREPAAGGNAGAGTASDSGSDLQNGQDESLLQAVFFDVGKGDCILLTMGQDHVLLDAGYEETWQLVTKELLSRGIDSLDAMIITHYDKDHVGGAAEIAEKIPVDIFYLPDYEGDADKCGDLLKYIEKKDLKSVRVDEQQKIALGEAEIEVDPALIQYDQQEKNDNDASLIVKIFYKEDEWLLPGDIEKDAIEIWLGENTQTFDILKMPHHGGREKNTKELLDNTEPEIAVITDSVLEEVPEKVLKQLEKRDITVYRSSVNGTITITGDGTGTYDVTSEK